MSDDSDLDKRRRQRFDALDTNLNRVAVETLEQAHSILVQAVTRHAEEVHTVDNNATPLLSSLITLLHETALLRRASGSGGSELGLVGAVDEHLNVMTPGALGHVGQILIGATANAPESGPLHDDVLTVLRSLAGLVNGELHTQRTRDASLEAEIGELLDDEPHGDDDVSD